VFETRWREILTGEIEYVVEVVDVGTGRLLELEEVLVPLGPLLKLESELLGLNSASLVNVDGNISSRALHLQRGLGLAHVLFVSKNDYYKESE
jgi:hypothetical protein